MPHRKVASLLVGEALTVIGCLYNPIKPYVLYEIGYRIKIREANVGMVCYEHWMYSGIRILELGNFYTSEHMKMHDFDDDGSIDQIMTSKFKAEHSKLKFYSNQERARELEKKFKKADKLFAEYKIKLKDIIDKAEKAWAKKYKKEHHKHF